MAGPTRRNRYQPELKPLPEYDIFRVPKVQNTIEQDFTAEYRPAAMLSSKASIEFNIVTAKDEYLRLYQTEFYLRLKICIEKPIKSISVTKDDWKNVSTCNNLLNSIFKQVEFWIGDRSIDPAHQTYAYKTYFEKLLGKSEEVKKTAADLGGWTEVVPSNPEDLIPHFNGKIKTIKTSGDFGEGQEFELLGKIHLPMFEQRKAALLGGCKLKLKFIPNDPQFYIKCTNEVQVKSVEFTDCSLRIQGAKLLPHIYNAHEKGLAEGNARYFLLENFVVPITINKGTQDIIIDNVHSGAVPNRAFIAFVDHRAFNGSHNLNPYNFQNFGVNHLQLYINGNPVGGPPKMPNFNKGWYSREYYDLFKVTNQDHIDTCITINKENFVRGNNIFAFKCSPDMTVGGAKALGFYNPIKYGAMRLHVRFDEALPQAVTALVYIDFDTFLEINQDRTVTYDI